MNELAKFTVIKVNNGFIVKVLNYGESMYKEPFKKETLVFEKKMDLINWISDFAEKDQND